jgi:hypothetical protein
MNMPISNEELSRIDKLFMDRDAKSLDESHNRRAQHGLHVRVGEDIKTSYGLQLALLTAINLGVKCFAGEAMSHGPSDLWSAPCLVPSVLSATLGDAVIELGGKLSMDNGLQPQGRYLLIGDAENAGNAIRVTYDGWRIAVGPSNEVSRMAERPYSPLASIAAAAIAVGEVFAEFAGISITATRRVVSLSLWRPDLPSDHPDGIGEQIIELPASLGIFGLGHLGQAYLWGFAALSFSCRDKITILLCDDDLVEGPNVETGALLTLADVTQRKTRVVAKRLEMLGFSTVLLERRVDANYRLSANEPAIALCGFDDNLARQWLSQAGFKTIFDSGLGGEAHNFDTIAYHAWPNPRLATDVWPLESIDELAARDVRKIRQVAENAAYQAIGADECGRLRIAGKSVAVPFVGAVAACIVLAEMLKAINGGPTYSDLKLRVCALGAGQFEGRLASEAASPIRGLATQAIGLPAPNPVRQHAGFADNTQRMAEPAPVKKVLQQVLDIPLEDIVGEHPEIETLTKELSLPPLYLPPDCLLRANTFHLLTSCYPITVVKQKTSKNNPQETKYLCTGHIRLFRWCKAYLGPKSVIPVIVRTRLKHDIIRENYLIELLIVPALLGAPPKSLKPLASAWIRADDKGLLHKLVTSTDVKTFAKLFGVDHRVYKKNG